MNLFIAFDILILVMTPNIDSNAVPTKPIEPMRATFLSKIVHILDLTFLKDAIYVNIALGFSFAMFSENMFNALVPIFLVQKGFSQVGSNSLFPHHV